MDATGVSLPAWWRKAAVSVGAAASLALTVRYLQSKADAKEPAAAKASRAAAPSAAVHADPGTVDIKAAQAVAVEKYIKDVGISMKATASDAELNNVGDLAKYLAFKPEYGTKFLARPDVGEGVLLKVTDWRLLTPEDYDRTCFHLEVDIKGTSIEHLCNGAHGKALSVYATNDPEKVGKFMKEMGIDPLAVVSVEEVAPQNEDGMVVLTTMEKLFTQYLDIFGKPTRAPPSPGSSCQVVYDGGGLALPPHQWPSGCLLGRLDSSSDSSATSAEWQSPHFTRRVTVTAASARRSPKSGCGYGCGWPPVDTCRSAASLLFGEACFSAGGLLAPATGPDVCSGFCNPGRFAPQRTLSLHDVDDAVIADLLWQDGPLRRQMFPAAPVAVRSNDDAVSQTSTYVSSSSWCSDSEQAPQRGQAEKPMTAIPLRRHCGDSPCGLVSPGPTFLASAVATRPEDVLGDPEVPRYPSTVDSAVSGEADELEQRSTSGAKTQVSSQHLADTPPVDGMAEECHAIVEADTSTAFPVADLRQRFAEAEELAELHWDEERRVHIVPDDEDDSLSVVEPVHIDLSAFEVDSSLASAFAELAASLAAAEADTILPGDCTDESPCASQADVPEVAPVPSDAQTVTDIGERPLSIPAEGEANPLEVVPVALEVVPVAVHQPSIVEVEADMSTDCVKCLELPSVDSPPLPLAPDGSGPRPGRPPGGRGRSPPRRDQPRARSSSPRSCSARPWRRAASGTTSRDQLEDRLLGLCAAASKDDSQVHRAAVWLAISQLVEVAQGSTPEFQEQAAQVLEQLASEDPDYKAKVAESGAVPLLVELLSVNGACSAHAAGALARLAMHSPINRALIATAGAIPRLLDILQRATLPLVAGSPEAVAIRALLHISRNSQHNKASIFQAEGVPMLVRLLKHSTPEVAYEVAEALGSLAANHPVHEELIFRALADAGIPRDGLALRAVEEPVTLHIYDVSGDARVQLVNDLFRPAGTGAFHAGVEIFGQEWSFGARHERGTGVFRCEPRRNSAHTYREAVPMDVTTLTKREVDEVILRLERQWSGRDYNLLYRNCCHFCDALCEELGVGPTPPWITNLAVAGANLVSGMRTAVAAGRVTAQAVCEVAREVDERYQIWGTAEAAVRDIVSLAQRALPPDETQQSRTGSAALLPAQALGLGGLARGLLAGVSSHLWPDAPGGAAAPSDSVDVLLECLYSAFVDVATLPQWQRCIVKKIARDSSCPVGLRHQPKNFRHLVPDLALLPEEHRDNKFFFELAWQPPCLYLRKPHEDTPITVSGAPVRPLTYVLLSHVEIELCAKEGGATCFAFRMVRFSERRAGEAPSTAARGRLPQRVARPRSCPHSEGPVSP